MSFVKVANINDIEEGRGKLVQADGKDIALFKKDGKIYAIENKCKHEGGQLAEGEVNDKIVTCPLHQWKYDITTGEGKTVPGVNQNKYNVKIEDEDVLVEID